MTKKIIWRKLGTPVIWKPCREIYNVQNSNNESKISTCRDAVMVEIKKAERPDTVIVSVKNLYSLPKHETCLDS